ncbi:trypsin-like peptidase domain-containing protein [Pseudomonas cichorii]|uniref:S1 family peptidase n=1 Tax=Pseudomonas cichorii TaxID=36746 RepID=UPI0018E648E3|nr:serine protease [Pseudomonas cichorii]MBI6853134.1 trypsin-like peptidase domain-containing protein [Pseudomonas cichorii]
MHKEIYENIQRCCGYVTVVLDEEVISQGTCFAFTPDGEVITAAHVVTGRVPILHKDYSDPNAKIFVKFAGRPVLEYRVSFCGLNIQCAAFTEAIQLDIAALAPKENQDEVFSYLPARIMSPNLGQQVFVSGFSDDLSLPFSIDRVAEKDFPGMQDFLSAMKKGYMADMMGPLIKRAAVGNHRKIIAEDSSQNLTVEVDLFYLDNGVNSGASGGPVVNEDGEAIGVISQRAVTSASQKSVPDLKVPAGATIALSLHPMNAIHQIMKKNA